MTAISHTDRRRSLSDTASPLPSATILGKLIAMDAATNPTELPTCCQCGNPVPPEPAGEWLEPDDDGQIACYPCWIGSGPA